MPEPADSTLLDRFAGSGDAAAFDAFMRRHLDLVYSAALRQTARDPHRAHDVTQKVFLIAARRARLLAGHPLLTGWLHRTTRHIAAELRRAETRRRRHETAHAAEAALLAAPPVREIPVHWPSLGPLLDAALDTLGDQDRETILLRYFAQKPFAEIATALDTTEAAAQMRATRALEKLRRALAARGVTSTASALGLALTGHAVTAAPAAVAASTLAALATSSTAILHTANSTGLYSLLPTFMKLTPAKNMGLLAFLALLLGGLLVPRLLERRVLSFTPARSSSADSRLSSANPPGPAFNEASLAHVSPPSLRFDSPADYQNWIMAVLLAAGPDETFTLLKSGGVTLSRASFDLAHAKIQARIQGEDGRHNLRINGPVIFYDYIKSWLGETPLAAADWIMTGVPVINTHYALLFELNRAARTDPELRQGFSTRYQHSALFPDLHALLLADTDAPAALDYVSASASKLRTVNHVAIVNTAFTSWWAKDASSAAAWALDPANSDWRRAVLVSLGRDASDVGRTAAAAILETMTGREKERAVRDYGNQLSFADPATGAAFLAENASFLKGEEIGMLSQALGRLAAHDPQAAISLAQSHNLSAATYGPLAREWARKNPTAALAWAETETGEIRETALRGALAGLAAQDPAAALDLSTTLDLRDLVSARRDPICDLAAKDPAAAAIWLRDHTTGADLETLAHAAVATIAMRSPEAALDFYAATGVTPRADLALELSRAISVSSPETSEQLIRNFVNQPEIYRAVVAGAITDKLAADFVSGRTHTERYFSTDRTVDEVLFKSVYNSIEYYLENARDTAARVIASPNLTSVAAAERADAARILTQNWARTAPDSALQWASALRDPVTAAGARAGLERTIAQPTPAQQAILDRLPTTTTSAP
jgi:RNA polymerase sigma factor (sigma-70 family)